MRQLLLYVLLVAVLLPGTSPWGTIAYFHANRAYIARVLCENRDKPELHCDGQCYLAKKLKAQQDRQDKETTERVQHLPALQWFCQSNVAFQFAPGGVATLAGRVFIYRFSRYAAPRTGLFRPPRG